MFLRSLFASLSRSQLPMSPPLLNRSVANPTVPWFFACNRPLGVLRGEAFGSAARTDDCRRPLVAPLPPPTSDKAEMYKGLEAALGTPFSSDSLSPPPNPIVLVISGPSGVGKDAVIKRLLEVREEGIHFIVTATSRPQRPGEIDGKDYYFVTKEGFLKMAERSELLEYALVYGDYKGIPKQQVDEKSSVCEEWADGRDSHGLILLKKLYKFLIRDYMAKDFDIVLRVDIQGAATLRSILGDSAVFIFLVAESEAALVKRLVARNTETPEMLLVRIATAKEEFKHMRKFDYVVVNAEGKLDDAVKLVESIIDAEKARVWQRKVQI